MTLTATAQADLRAEHRIDQHPARRAVQPPPPRWARIPRGRIDQHPARRAVQRLIAAARRPVSADSTAVFRIGFGLLAVYSSVRFLAKGWVDRLYLEPAHHLSYPGFGWVQPWPSPWMHLHVAVLALLGACIALGYRHRLAAALFVVGFAYVEMIDAALYLNHYWYVTLAGLLMVLLPVHHRWSLDAWLGRVAPARCVPVAVVWVLRAQLGVVYVFAGLAKLNGDWLFRAQPRRLWLADRTHLPVVGPLLDEPLLAYAASWAGAFFDLTIVAWLLWGRSRPWAYAAVVVFHLATGALFQIGVFPWVMIVGTLVFFPPHWPERLRAAAGSRSTPPKAADRAAKARVAKPVAAALVLLAVVELVLPLRHYAYPGNVRWTEEGYYWSWRVMVTEKAGYAQFRVTDPSTGRTWQAGPGLVLTDWQAEQAAVRPDLIHATAHLLAEHYRQQGRTEVEVRADVWVSMNGRPPQRLVDPSVDLAARPRTQAPKGWILGISSPP